MSDSVARTTSSAFPVLKSSAFALTISRIDSKEAMKQLRALGGVPESPTASASAGSVKEKKLAAKASVTDCCICEAHSAPMGLGLSLIPCDRFVLCDCTAGIVHCVSRDFDV